MSNKTNMEYLIKEINGMIDVLVELRSELDPEFDKLNDEDYEMITNDLRDGVKQIIYAYGYQQMIKKEIEKENNKD